MVLSIGIFLNKSFTIFNKRFPKKDKESHPINIINTTDTNISSPGIENGK
jgi:hypothetical protein